MGLAAVSVPLTCAHLGAHGLACGLAPGGSAHHPAISMTLVYAPGTACSGWGHLWPPTSAGSPRSPPPTPTPEDVSGAGGVLGRRTLSGTLLLCCASCGPSGLSYWCSRCLTCSASMLQAPPASSVALLGTLAVRCPFCLRLRKKADGLSLALLRASSTPISTSHCALRGVCTCAELPLPPGLPAASPCLFLQGGPRCPSLLLAHPSACLLCYYSGWQGRCQPGLLGAKPPGPKQ